MLLNFFFFRFLHILNLLQNTMYVASPRIDTDSISPADFEMTNGSSVAFANIEQPVEDVVIVFGVGNQLICAIEDGGGFGVYETTGAKERGIGGYHSSRVAIVDEALLK